MPAFMKRGVFWIISGVVLGLGVLAAVVAIGFRVISSKVDPGM